jgi:quinol-cytochrome oxidoreductase complex cytochrome b subunit
LFLHIHSVRVHVRTLEPTLTFGLGLISAASFLILCVTGVLLMVYYKPSTALAYDSVKDIHFVVFTGRFIRNIHRWAAHIMVVAVFLHMARVFYTGSYKKPREFNWLVGLGLLVLTLALSFTGYLLPYDQLAYWAITIGSNIANSPRELTDAIGITGRIAKKIAARRELRGRRRVDSLLHPARFCSAGASGDVARRAFLAHPQRRRAGASGRPDGR